MMAATITRFLPKLPSPFSRLGIGTALLLVLSLPIMSNADLLPVIVAIVIVVAPQFAIIFVTSDGVWAHLLSIIAAFIMLYLAWPNSRIVTGFNPITLRVFSVLLAAFESNDVATAVLRRLRSVGTA